MIKNFSSQKPLSFSVFSQAAVFFSAFFSVGTFADGFDVGKVYLPYVNALEREIEYRALGVENGEEWDQRHWLGAGFSASDKLFVEGYVIHDKEGSSLDLSAIELEARWQLTEQGEYSADWGVMVELEKEVNKVEGENVWEASSVLLTSKSFQRWSLNANTILKYEWGKSIQNEVEFGFSGQAVYRYKSSLEPMVELHIGESYIAAGPAAQGQIRGHGKQKWFWSTALLWANTYPEEGGMVKGALEFEF